MTKGLLVILPVLLFVQFGHSQNCSMTGSADDTLNKKLGPPVIFGQSISIPSMVLHFDAQDGSTPQSVELRYQWQWIQYPYPEHSWGAWVTSSETVECNSPGANLTVPARTVAPRGWYKGKYTALPWRKPKFQQIEMVVAWEANCSQRVMLDDQLLKKFQNSDAVLKKSCGEPIETKFISKGGR